MKELDRRSFLKTVGLGTVALGAAVACGRDGSSSATYEGPAEMPYRKNSRTGDMVSILGYGCMRWPMITDASGAQVIDQQSVDEMVDYAISHGVNYFDSAPVYLQGQSEAATALALSRYPRDSYYIATKLSNHRGSEPTYEAGVAMYKRSLGYYNTDYIDYYLLHNLDGYASFKKRFEDNGLIDFLLKERQAGHIRNLGFSFHGGTRGFDQMMELHGKYHWDFVQIQMNYVDWDHAGGGDANAHYLYDTLTGLGIPVVIMEPLLGGQLSSVPRVVADRLKEREPSKSVASWAFRFCGTHPNVLTVLSGMTYMSHLEDNVDTFEHFVPLNDKELEMLQEAAGIIRDYPLVGCTGCQYCMPCPFGIDIPGIFKHYNACVNDGTVAESSDQKDFHKLRRKYLASYSEAIDPVRQADHCISCGQCAPRCPQHIRIPNELRRIDNYIEKLKQETL